MAGAIEEFAVKFQVYNKIVRNDEFPELLADIRHAFRSVKDFPENFLVKYESEKFGFVDLDDPSDLEFRKSNLLLVEKLEGEKTRDSDEELELSGSRNNDIPNENDQSKEFENENWPHPFLIKDHMVRKSILEKIDGRKEEVFLSESERTSIFMGVYDECAVKYDNIYPSKYEYRDMIEALFKRFPGLSKESHSYEASFLLWKGRLRSHFKRQRGNRKNNENPEIIDKRQKFGSKRKASEEDASNQPPKKKIMCWGVVNFLPPMEAGEDDVSITHYQKEMISQLKHSRERRDSNKIQNLMEKTFPHRRKLLVQELVRLKDLVELYPLLCTKEQVLAEFKRITGWCLEERLKFSLRKYSAFIIANKSSLEKDVLSKLKIKCSSTHSEEERQYYMMCVALLAIPFHFRESPFAYFEMGSPIEENERRNCPRLKTDDVKAPEDIVNIFDGSFTVRLEDFDIAETNDFMEAMMCLLAAYYVFNVEYPKDISSTLIFIQKFFLNISDKSKTPDKVSKYIGLVKKGTYGL